MRSGDADASSGKRGRKQVRPDPAAGPVAEFAHELLVLKERAGDPSYERMRTQFGAAASKSALSSASRGRDLPSWDTTWQFVRCLAVSALRADEQAVWREWKAKWERARTAGAAGAADSDAGGNEPVKAPVPPARRTRRRVLIGAGVFSAAVLMVVTVAFWSPLWTSESSGDADELRPMPGDASVFLGDVTMPDGIRVKAGDLFVKEWEIRNAGTVPWTNRYLQRMGGDEGPAECRTPSRVAIPPTQPGSNVRLSVMVSSGTTPGLCKVYWKMVDERGVQYLPSVRPIYFSVVVVP